MNFITYYVILVNLCRGRKTKPLSMNHVYGDIFRDGSTHSVRTAIQSRTE